jgi:hypothetical protein
MRAPNLDDLANQAADLLRLVRIAAELAERADLDNDGEDVSNVAGLLRAILVFAERHVDGLDLLNKIGGKAIPHAPKTGG